MAEVLVQFDEPYQASTGRLFIAQVCGQSLGNGLWEGWIQFMPSDGGEPVRTRRETEQFSRGDLRYWAAGLTRHRLQELLSHALSEYRIHTPWNEPIPMIFDDIDPEERIVFDSASLVNPPLPLDPFALYAQGEHVLRQQLHALDAAQLRDIVIAYDIPNVDIVGSASTFEEALAHRIVAGVQQRVAREHPSEQLYDQRIKQ